MHCVECSNMLRVHVMTLICPIKCGSETGSRFQFVHSRPQASDTGGRGIRFTVGMRETFFTGTCSSRNTSRAKFNVRPKGIVCTFKCAPTTLIRLFLRFIELLCSCHVSDLESSSEPRLSLPAKQSRLSSSRSISSGPLFSLYSQKCREPVSDFKRCGEKNK